MADYSMRIYGHRGAAGEAPENTIAGCRHAIARGVKRIEVDLRLSSDKQLVIIHDKNLKRTSCSNNKEASHYTAAELDSMDCRNAGPPWPDNKNTGVPTLDKLLDTTPELEHYQLEVKSGRRAIMDTIAQLLAERFPTAEASEKVVITSASTVLLTLLTKYAPHLQRGIVATTQASFKTATALHLDYYCMHWSLCNPLLVRKLNRLKINSSVWTVNDATLIKSLHQMKVHSIITDYPSMAIPLVASLERN